MHRAKLRFDESFQRINKVNIIYLHWVNVLHLTSSEVEDLLRAQIVYAVSALDKLIHDLVKIGMVETFDGRRHSTLAYQNFGISLDQHSELISPAAIIPPNLLIQNIIERKHGYLSFQDPEKLKDALSLIWNEQHKWQVIAHSLGLTEVLVKQKLNNIIIRRNQIAHEMDLDLSTGTIQTINQIDTENSVKFIKDLGDTIYNLVI